MVAGYVEVSHMLLADCVVKELESHKQVGCSQVTHTLAVEQE